MLLTKNINIKTTGKMINRYNQLGYDCKHGSVINIPIELLSKKSNCIIEYLCDYCGNMVRKRYADYTKTNGLDCCHLCIYNKIKEVCLQKYGVDNPMKVPENLDKLKKSFINKYGVSYPTQNKDVIKKTEQTNMLKYGVKCVLKNEEIKDRIKNTNLARYGVENVFANKDTQIKIRNTLKNKYGVENPMKNKIIAEKSKCKANQSLFKNNSQISSKQQRYIHSIMGGTLNYLFDNLFLDIFFDNLNVYVEWNGSGHDIDVKYGKITEKDFKHKEIKRYKFLKSHGLKEALFISKKDYVPSKDIVLYLKDYICDLLINKGFNWVEFNLDNNTIKYKGCLTYFDYEKMLI